MILNLNSTVNLEKHSGRKLNEIIRGFEATDKHEVVNQFLREYVGFFSKNVDFDILIPSFFKNGFFEKKIVRNDDFRNSYIKFDEPLDYMNGVQFIDFDTILINQSENKAKERKKISYFITSTLETDFSFDRPFFGTYKKKKKPMLTNKIKNCFADPAYISWCITHLENFALDEEAIEGKYEISSLLKFECLPINHQENDTDLRIRTLHGYNIYYDKTCSVICKPVVTKSLFEFDDTVKKINYQNLKKIRMREFLNSRPSYNEDDWLQDAAGTDDSETMNDTYWNLD